MNASSVVIFITRLPLKGQCQSRLNVPTVTPYRRSTPGKRHIQACRLRPQDGRQADFGLRCILRGRRLRPIEPERLQGWVQSRSATRAPRQQRRKAADPLTDPAAGDGRVTQAETVEGWPVFHEVDIARLDENALAARPLGEFPRIKVGLAQIGRAHV